MAWPSNTMPRPHLRRACCATPLYAVHRRLGARMVDFAGWDMPVQYPTGILAEHPAVRSGCGVFDLSHMGRVCSAGEDALPLAQECCTRDLARIRRLARRPIRWCATADGGILDDVIAYGLARSEVLFVFNASNRDRRYALVRSAARQARAGRRPRRPHPGDRPDRASRGQLRRRCFSRCATPILNRCRATRF